MDKRKYKNRGWYYRAETGFFDEIFYWDHIHTSPDNALGPFGKFTDARQDAIEYFMCDIKEAKRALMEVRGFKQPEIKK